MLAGVGVLVGEMVMAGVLLVGVKLVSLLEVCSVLDGLVID